jgi:DNA-binding NarL/FixJ family response regulator
MLAHLPPLLAGIMDRALSKQTDLEIVAAEPRPFGSLADRVARAHPDVLLAGLSEAEREDAYLTLFAAHDSLRLILIDADARAASVYELRPQRTVLREVSLDAILDAIRAPVHTQGAWDA